MNMGDEGHTANGRYMMDPYKSLQAQWMIHPQQMGIHTNPHTTALMKVNAERTNAIQERNMALSEKKVALAERDMVILQRDTAIADRDNAIMLRDSAIAALEFARQNMNANRQQASVDMQPSPLQLLESPLDHTRGINISDSRPISSLFDTAVKVQQSKQRRKENKTETVPLKASKSLKNCKRGGGTDLNEATAAVGSSGTRGRKRRASSMKLDDGKVQDLILNQIKFDESTMPPPVCSCTGKLHQCYKWGNGGWQSACCTTFVSKHPLPSQPEKPHARVGGRKMSASPFQKLLSRLVSEGHDLSTPLDLKDHWARHGTNRYITIK